MHVRTLERASCFPDCSLCAKIRRKKERKKKSILLSFHDIIMPSIFLYMAHIPISLRRSHLLSSTFPFCCGYLWMWGYRQIYLKTELKLALISLLVVSISASHFGFLHPVVSPSVSLLFLTTHPAGSIGQRREGSAERRNQYYQHTNSQCVEIS